MEYFELQEDEDFGARISFLHLSFDFNKMPGDCFRIYFLCLEWLKNLLKS